MIHANICQHMSGGDGLEQRTKRSAALPVNCCLGADASFTNDMFLGDDDDSCSGGMPVEAVSRNGLRETGRGGSGFSARPGDVARFRKGLFEDRLTDNPGDSWLSVDRRHDVSGGGRRQGAYDGVC